MPTVYYEGPEVLRANQLFKACIRIKTEEEIETGGRIVVAVKHVSDFGNAQTDNPEGENYIEVVANRKGAQFKLDNTGKISKFERHPWYRHPWNMGFELILEKGIIYSGDMVEIKLGGNRGFRCQSFSEDIVYLRIAEKRNEKSPWIVAPLSESPSFTVTGTEPSAIRINMADVNGASSRRTLCIKVEDTYGNPTEVYKCKLSLLLDDKQLLGQHEVRSCMQEIEGIAIPDDGKWHRITAASDDGRFFARSNPFGPSLADGFRLFWGDLHCMTGYCFGTNNAAYLYKYGREAAGLDFASVTVGDMLLTPEIWDEVKKATRDAHRPGSYITFLAYEWCGNTDRGGDNNIYFPGDDGNYIYNGMPSPPGISEEWYDNDKNFDRVRTIRDAINELDDRVLVIPHCGGRQANFDFYDSSKMPIMEMHSTHRSFEDVAMQVLEKGIKVGFAGGSDDHRGALGDSVPVARDNWFSARNGLIGVYAEKLTRESIWEAIFARRVYATNGCKAALIFTVGDVLMGSEMHVKAGEQVKFQFRVVTDGWFDHAELVCGSETLARFSGKTRHIDGNSGAFEITAKRGTFAYYLRVYQVDWGRVWSSPIWVSAD